MYRKYALAKPAFLFFLCLLSINLFAQAPGAKKTPVKGGKFTVKATIASDMDCLVTINGAAKTISVKAYTPTPVTINGGENTIDAVSADKKSSFKTTVKVNAGETPIIEISFFDDNKFLDYIKQGNVGMVETAIKKNPSLATNENESLATSPLEIAIQNSQLEIVKLLMDKGASFTKPESIFPLHKSVLYASSTKKPKEKTSPDRDLVDFFLSKGCKISDKDDGGNTPLHCAARAGKLELLTYLIEKGADVNAKNDFEDTPLKIAQNKGYISIINYLKLKGAEDK